MTGQARFFLTLLTFLVCATSAQAKGPYPTLSAPAQVQKSGSADVAIIVAVEDYVFLPDVAGATQNGNDWERFFADSLGVPTVHFVSNSQATKEELERFAILASQSAQPGGTVWFIFIGHGAPSKDGKQGLLVGSDARQDPNSLFARGVPQQTLLDILQTGPQAQTVLIVDACFSGRASDGAALAPAQPVIPTKITPTIQSNTVVMTAAEASEFAGSLPGENRPAFSYLLLGALRGWASDTSQTVSAQSAQRYVQRALRGIPGRMTQTPSIHGKADLVLTRGVAEKDPGIYELLREQAKFGQPIPVPGPSPIGNIPSLPDVLNPNGAIGLSVDAELLVIRDQALKLDSQGESDPDAAAQGWTRVAEATGNNPFKEEAQKRAKLWEDFSKQRRDFASQKTSDLERLKKILPLESVDESNKAQLLANYSNLYGETEMVDLIAFVQPDAVRHNLCRPYVTAGSVPVTFDMPNDRDGEPFKGQVEVEGNVLGSAPGTYNFAKCADKIPVRVTEVSTGKVWEGSLSGIGGGSSQTIKAEYEGLMPYSFWHDYIWADAPGGPLLGVFYSQMNLPGEFNRQSLQVIRGNVEINFKGYGGHLSAFFEPSYILASEKQESAYSLGGGIGIRRLTAGRFSLSPLRVGYQKYYGSDIDGMSGYTGQAALRFHLGGGLQLRGDGNLIWGSKDFNGSEWEGLAWMVGGGLEYGTPVIYNTISSIFGDGSSDSDWSDSEWGEWSEGTMAIGYQYMSGYLPNQDAVGSFVFSLRYADSYDGGMILEFSGAHDSLGGIDSTNLGMRISGIFMGDDEDFFYGMGLAGGYNTAAEGDFNYYLLGADFALGWRIFSQVSLNAYTALNLFALFDMDEETLAEDGSGTVISKTTTMSPVTASLRWTTPWSVYLEGGTRADLGGSLPISGFGHVGYLTTID